jgi:hypothetical protein
LRSKVIGKELFVFVVVLLLVAVLLPLVRCRPIAKVNSTSALDGW